jgi:hypothetical protein
VRTAAWAAAASCTPRRRLREGRRAAAAAAARAHGGGEGGGGSARLAVEARVALRVEVLVGHRAPGARGRPVSAEGHPPADQSRHPQTRAERRSLANMQNGGRALSSWSSVPAELGSEYDRGAAGGGGGALRGAGRRQRRDGAVAARAAGAACGTRAHIRRRGCRGLTCEESTVRLHTAAWDNSVGGRRGGHAAHRRRSRRRAGSCQGSCGARQWSSGG